MSRYDDLQLPSIKQPHTIITSAELEQIKAHISQSEQKVKRSYDSQRVWASRIEKQRQQKEKEKFDKFLKEEEERRKIDQKEADFQEKLKQDQITDANNKIFGQRADVRTMKSKMLMSENQNVNEQLAKINQQHKESLLIQEAERTQMIETQKLLSEQAELQKSQIKEQLKKETYDMIAKQHHEVKERYLKEYVKLQQEGQLIKRQAEEDEILQIKKKEKQKEKKLKLLEEHKQILDIKQQIKDSETQILNKEAQDREHFQKHKDRVLQMRKEREAQKKQREVQLRKQIYDIRVVQIKEQEDNYLQRIQKHQEELQKHEEEVAKQKELEKSQMIQEGEAFRVLQTKLKEEVKEKQQIDLKQEHKLKINALEQLQIVEEQQKEILKKRNKELQDYQKIQIELKKQMRKNQFLNELKESQQMELRAQIEKDTFHNWAKTQVEETKEQGLNLYPLMKTLKQK